MSCRYCGSKVLSILAEYNCSFGHNYAICLECATSIKSHYTTERTCCSPTLASDSASSSFDPPLRTIEQTNYTTKNGTTLLPPNYEVGQHKVPVESWCLECLALDVKERGHVDIQQARTTSGGQDTTIKHACVTYIRRYRPMRDQEKQEPVL